MARTITAKFPSTCRTCGGRVLKGDRVRWERGAGVEHVNCGSARGVVVSTRCEDYPCCGHGPPPMGDGGGCPTRYADGTETFDCTTCGAELPPGATSALCDRCRRVPVGSYERAERHWAIDSAFYDPDEDVVDWREYGRGD